ncbi:MAG: hypothetical protein NTY30_02740 [Candidatus Berkelbacteria bacterium]|nr:hypothetical protein [Candidatus Berkelbacteria bacterium]
MNTKELKGMKQKLKLSKFQREVIVGMILGDGHLETNNDITYRLKIEHSIKQREYTYWLYKCLESWVLKEPCEKRKAVFGKVFTNIWFNTVSHVALRYYGKAFYKDKIKTIPINIAKLLTPVSMAVWFMDDGSIKSKFHKTLLINTQSFPKDKLEFLQKAIFQKFQINSNLRKQKEGFQLEFRGQDATRLAEIIEPYLVASMNYKIDPIGLTKLPKL